MTTNEIAALLNAPQLFASAVKTAEEAVADAATRFNATFNEVANEIEAAKKLKTAEERAKAQEKALA